MSNFREGIGRAFNSFDLSCREWETDIDRIASAAFAPKLGVLLWRLKFGLDPGAYKPAHKLLCRRVGASRDTVRRLCGLAIQEWCMPQCGTCNGARELVIEDRRIVCKECEGTGLRRYADGERERLAGLRAGAWPGWSKQYDQIMIELTRAELRVNVTLNIQLERLTTVETGPKIESNQGINGSAL